MTIVVGVAPSHCSTAAVNLGVLLARSYSRDLVLAAVTSAGWPGGGGGVDGEYQRFLAASARDALAAASALVPDDVRVRTVVHASSGARRGLLEVCAAESAIRLVVGSAGDHVGAAHAAETVAHPVAPGAHRARGIELGSVSLGLLQSAELPVAIAPHGFTAAPGARLERVTAAYSGSETSAELVLGAAAVAADAGAAIRIASFHTRPRGLLGAAIGFNAEAEVIAAWEAEIRDRAEALLNEIRGFATPPAQADVALGAGADWEAALRAIPWGDAEVLLVGSSSIGALARISLGSHAAKILRHAPVPVVMVPRRATEEYAERALEQLGAS
ncbi:universal stress protein [Leucobacter luti]|uniref:Nucleotide-binding universal stress UspA family protein n=1 Tax=Leucobacter luti TaxID=340320 RepID=A0A4V6MDQ0_9MICO|nr:universal stress protein [Leucobacter luti]MBL3700940.1 universal stress protein [Leucobacter luti]RZT68839.1 nucleotide-binding universal stress UspA family protein [Leucobacter luti]